MRGKDENETKFANATWYAVYGFGIYRMRNDENHVLCYGEPEGNR